MRVLVTSTPGTGHVIPLLPLASALAAAGHDVVWAAGSEPRAQIEAAGLGWVRAGLDLRERVDTASRSMPPPSSVPPERRRSVMFPAHFGALSTAPMAASLLSIADDVRPDVIVHEPCELAAAPVACRLGIPHVTVGFGRLIPDDLLELTLPQVIPTWREVCGIDPPADLGLYDHAYFHPLPPVLDPESTRPNLHLLRPAGVDRPDRLPASATATRRPADRPHVYVTFGTEFGPIAPWSHVLDAIPMAGATALVTLGSEMDPAVLGDVPDVVRVERWVPQADALADADLMISHAGSGAMLGALVAGVPHLAIPLAADNFDNASLLAAAGVGSQLLPPAVSAESIAGEIRHLPGDDDVRARLDVVSRAMAAMPGVDEAVAVVEMIVRE